jgi:ABC-type glycerol-3-phosphate transport system substrate-binding protein
VRYLTTGPGQPSIALDLAVPPADQTLLKDWYAKFPTVSAKDLEQCYTGAGKHWKETPASLIYGYIQVEDVYNQVMSTVMSNERPAAEALAEIEQKANTELKKI